MRPNLTKNIRLIDFQSYYWLKEELRVFCRQNGLSPTGSKKELTVRIEVYLQTGEIQMPNRVKKAKTQKQEILSLDTVITESHRCTQQARAFFKSVIGPKFHFSTFIQKYFKENVGKRYRDAVAAWYEEEERKKSPSYRKEIAPQFEYNQFIRDYFADPLNKGKGREEAINVWNKVKKLPGSNQYHSIKDTR